jgi:hypothetical protein
MTAMSNWNWTMEHYPNSEPMRRHKRFDFTAFDKLCAEALEEDSLMAEETRQLEEAQAWEDHDRVFLGKRPGEIGGVACRPTLLLTDQPAQPGNVVDLNANVTDLFPGPEAA